MTRLKLRQPIVTSMMKALVPIVSLALMASCQSLKQESVETSSPSTIALSTKAKAGFDVAEALCSGCHAIAPREISPNPESPTFMHVANTPDLNENSLREWLRNIHNYPEKMQFEIADDDVDTLAAYVITLREKGYTPPSQ